MQKLDTPKKIVSLKKIVFIITSLLVLFILGVFIKTALFRAPEMKKGMPLSLKEEDISDGLRRFRGALQIPTISNSVYSDSDFQPFDEFITYIHESYPLQDSFKFEFTRVNQYGLVYKWKGTNENLKPILFTAHYDVVPVNEKDSANWFFPPFSGTISDEKIYGRGTLDDKGSVISMLEAIKMLIEKEFCPERDIYFAFGHDEEQGGEQGAAKIASYFKGKNIEFESVLDEGGVVAVKGTGGINADMALIGVAEKGNANIGIRIKHQGGHSSMPPRKSAVGEAAEIITNLESNQMEPEITSPVYNMLFNVCNSMGFTTKMAIANIWIFKPLLIHIFESKPSTNAMIRTTTAITMINGSKVPNILPQTVEVVGNFRILPGNTVEDVVNHVKEICEKNQAEVFLINGTEPSPVSSERSNSFNLLKESIEKYYPNAIVTPYLTMAATDARHYYKVSSNVYRFMPVMLTEKEQGLMHNSNEYISIENFKRMIFFYQDLFQRMGK